MVRYNHDHEPIVVSKPTLDLFLQQDNPADLIALYTFYYYTAKWQQTNIIRCTVGYVATGLNWSLEKVRKTRTTLLELNMIEDVQDRTDGRKFGERYVQVNFIWSRNDLNRTTENRTTEKPYYGEPQTNALRDGREYLLKRKNIKKEKVSPSQLEQSISEDPFLKIAQQISRIIAKHYPNDVITDRKVQNWIKPIKAIFKEWNGTPEELSSMLSVYYRHFDKNDKMHLVIKSGEALKEKRDKLERFVAMINKTNPPTSRTTPVKPSSTPEPPKKQFRVGCDPHGRD